MRRCSKCSTEKLLSEFSHNNNYCRPCAKEYSKVWYHANKARARSTHDAWLLQHPDYKTAPTAEQQSASYYKFHERNKQKRRNHYYSNKEKYQVYVNNRRARCADGYIDPDEFKELCARYGNRCLCCGTSGKMTIDHVIPLSRGGDNTIDNIQPLCLNCNKKKHTKEIDYREDTQWLTLS